MRASLALLVLLMSCVPRVRPTNPVEWENASIACRRGAQDACFWVGISKEERGDFAGARALYLPACDAGVVEACSQLATNLFNGTGVAKDDTRAVAMAERVCEQGSATACHLAGIGYYRARGVARDLAKSTALYARACAAGDSSSCRDYGNALAEGRGVPVDLPRARALWRKTCPEEDMSCHRLMTSLETENPAAALEVAREGCRAGGRASCRRAGIWFWTENRDLEKAARYFRTACAWGDADSCPALGLVLRELDPPGDLEAALVWTESCGRGEKRSCHRLASYKLTRDGRSEALVAEIEALCREGIKESCTWLCKDGKQERCAPDVKTPTRP